MSNKPYTDGVTYAQALQMIEPIKKAQSLSYPDGFEELESIWRGLLKYVIDNNLKDTNFYLQLNNKVKNFDVRLPVGSQLSIDLFDHMTGQLDLFGDMIAMELHIPYGGFSQTQPH
jgi:hypothetical protein